MHRTVMVLMRRVVKMYSLKILFLIFALTSSFSLFAQVDKEKIISAFDKTEYYSDSTIQSVYKIKNGLYDGYSIDFDSLGNPVAIGKYKKGIPVGAWYSSDGSMQLYEKGEMKDDMIPGCGTGISKSKKEFQQMYQDLINGRKPKRK